MTRDSNVWLSHAQIVTLLPPLFQTSIFQIEKMLKNKELKVDSVVKQYLTTASDGQQILKHHTSAFTNKLSKFALAC